MANRKLARVGGFHEGGAAELHWWHDLVTGSASKWTFLSTYVSKVVQYKSQYFPTL